jgi:hypothetical protein
MRDYAYVAANFWRFQHIDFVVIYFSRQLLSLAGQGVHAIASDSVTVLARPPTAGQF